METSTLIHFSLYLVVFLIVILAIINLTNPPKTKHELELNQIRHKKKKYSNINIYDAMNQEFKEKITQCLDLQRISINKKEHLNLKEIIEKDKKLHESITNKLTKIEEKIVKQIASSQNNNIDIKSKITETLDNLIYLMNNKNEIKNKITETLDNLLYLIFPNKIKSEAVKIFHDILSIIILREYLLFNTKELKDKYTDFLMLLLYVKLSNPIILYTNQELKEAFELEKEEMILLEKIEFIKPNKLHKLPLNSPTFIETLERFANISKFLFESFDELYLAYMPKHITKKKKSKNNTENTNNNSRENTNNNENSNNTNNENNNEAEDKNEDQNETANKYRVII